jgi:hypothetical protein
MMQSSCSISIGGTYEQRGCAYIIVLVNQWTWGTAIKEDNESTNYAFVEGLALLLK